MMKYLAVQKGMYVFITGYIETNSYGPTTQIMKQNITNTPELSRPSSSHGGHPRFQASNHH